MTAGLQVGGLSVRRDGRPVLSDVSLEVPTGVCTVLLGAAGSGKTTLAAALTGLIPATRGTVAVGGRLLGGPPSVRRRHGLAAAVQDGEAIRGVTVAEALALSARGGRRAGDALERLPLLRSRARLRADRLSGGEQQLLQVACAWCAQADVLVLDSPTVGLATRVAAAVRALSLDEAQRGAAVLWLDQDVTAAPLPAGLALAGGAVLSLTGSESARGWTGTASPRD